ncbi:MAG: tetratricopeptide repeat protein [Elusimicrobia bacterium]|nr:tetratricopeptide repeat protein [Elusimicrobiota bacterium]
MFKIYINKLLQNRKGWAGYFIIVPIALFIGCRLISKRPIQHELNITDTNKIETANPVKKEPSIASPAAPNHSETPGTGLAEYDKPAPNHSETPGTGLAKYMDSRSGTQDSRKQEIPLQNEPADVDLFREIPEDRPKIPVADWVDAEIKTLVFTGFDEPQKSIAELFRNGKYNRLNKLIQKNVLPDIQKEYISGELEFAKKRYPESIKHYDSILSTGTESDFPAYAMFRKAEALYNTGEFGQALVLFNKITPKKDFLIPEIEFSKAQCYLKTGETEKALGIMEQLISNYQGYHPDDRLNYCIGLVLYYRKRSTEALDFFRKADTPHAMFYSAKCLEDEGRFLPAVSVFKNIIEKHRNSTLVDDSMFNLGMVFYRMKEYGPAAESFLKLLEYTKSPYRPYTRLMLGLCRFDMGYYKLAIKNCEYFLRDHAGTRPEAYIRRLLAKSYARLRWYKLAIDEYEKVINDYTDTPVRVYSACDLALLYYLTGKYDSAVRYCDISEKIAEGTGPQKNIMFLKGMCFYRKGDMASAQEQFQGIINSVPDNEVRGRALFMLGLTYIAEGKNESLFTGHFDLADKEGLFSAEWKAWAYYFIANAYYNLGKFADARKASEYILNNYAGSKAAKYAKNIIIACAVLDNDYDEAELKNREFLDSYRDDEDVKKISLLVSAGIQFNKGNYEKAILLYKDFTDNYRRDDNIYEALFMQGESFYRLGHYNEAIKRWKRIIGTGKDTEYSIKAYERLAYTSFGLGKYSDAVSYYRGIQKYFPESGLSREAGLHIAQCYYNGGNYKQAINAYKKFLSEYPDYEKKDEVLENIRMVYYERGMESADNDAGLTEFVNLYPKGTMAGEAYWQLGTRAYGRGEYGKAAEIFRKIISDYPQIESSKQALYYLAECLYALKKNKEAVNTFESFIKSFPDDELSTTAEFHMANALFSMGEVEESQKYYSNIINNKPDADFAPNAMLNKALGYKKLKKWEEAVSEYKLFLTKYPEHEKKGYAVFQIAEINRNTGNYKEAAGYYKQVPPASSPTGRSGPDTGEAGPPGSGISESELLYLTADAYEKAGDSENAGKYYIELVNLKNKEKTFYLAGLVKVAEFYLKEGKNEEAKDAYKKIMTTAENEEWIAAAEAKIMEIEEREKIK